MADMTSHDCPALTNSTYLKDMSGNGKAAAKQRGANREGCAHVTQDLLHAVPGELQSLLLLPHYISHLQRRP